MTVTVTLALLPPAVAVTVALPAFDPAVTTPVPITFATELSELVHVTLRSVASSGLTVAVNCTDSPDFSESLPSLTPSPETDTDETGTGTFATVTVIEEDISPAVAVMVVVPTFRAVTLPSDTFATELSELSQETVLLVALSGLTVAVNCADEPTFRLSLPSLTPLPEIVTDSTGIGC